MFFSMLNLAVVTTPKIFFKSSLRNLTVEIITKSNQVTDCKAQTVGVQAYSSKFQFPSEAANTNGCYHSLENIH